MAKKKRYNKSDLNKRDSNYVKYGSSDKLASIYGELQTAENKDISKLYTNILSNGKIIESFGENLIENQFAARYFITNNQMEFQSINITLNQESTHLDDMPIQFIELNNKDLISRIDGNKLVQLDSDNFTEKYRYEFDSYIDGYSNVDDMLIINIENQMLVYDINTGEKITELSDFMNTIKNLSGEVKVVSSPTKDYLYYCNNSKLFGYNLKDNTSTEPTDDFRDITEEDVEFYNILNPRIAEDGLIDFDRASSTKYSIMLVTKDPTAEVEFEIGAIEQGFPFIISSESSNEYMSYGTASSVYQTIKWSKENYSLGEVSNLPESSNEIVTNLMEGDRFRVSFNGDNVVLKKLKDTEWTIIFEKQITNIGDKVIGFVFNTDGILNSRIKNVKISV